VFVANFQVVGGQRHDANGLLLEQGKHRLRATSGALPQEGCCMASRAPTGAVGDLGTVHHRAKSRPGHTVPWSNRARFQT
jgi:hypothetical protein